MTIRKAIQDVNVVSIQFQDGTIQTTAAGGGGGGISQLTGDVLAGPGTGSQAAVIAGQGGNAGKFLTTNGTSTSWAAAGGAQDIGWFGTGRQGNLTINSGTTTLQNDAYFNNLTINGTGVLNTNGYRLHVAGTLDISGAQTGAIICNGGDGTSSSGPFRGFLGSAAPGNSLPPGATGSTGGDGGTATGNAASSSINNSFQQLGGQYDVISSQAGDGSAGTGGNRTIPAGGIKYFQDHLDVEYLKRTAGGGSVTVLQAGTGGVGGPGGGGDNVASGGGGGGGGGGAGMVWIAARVINRGSNTNPSIIQAVGGAGGNGGPGATGNTGGGGGGAGGAGGVLVIAYMLLNGSTINNALDVSSGLGGIGGNGSGSGKGGGGGGAGQSGVLMRFDLGAGTTSFIDVAPAIAGDAQSSTTSGLAGHRNVSLSNL